MGSVTANASDARDRLISGDCAAHQRHGGVKNTASLSGPAVAARGVVDNSGSAVATMASTRLVPRNCTFQNRQGTANANASDAAPVRLASITAVSPVLALQGIAAAAAIAAT